MQRLTTPKHTFKIKYQADTLDKIKITYSQDGVPVLEKYKEDCTLDGNIIICRLSQEDTQKFKPSDVKIQLRIKTASGDVINSKKYTRFCEDVLDEEVL